MELAPLSSQEHPDLRAHYDLFVTSALTFETGDTLELYFHLFL